MADLFGLVIHDHHTLGTVFHGRDNGVVQAFTVAFLYFQTVNNNFNIMNLVAVQFHPTFDIAQFAVNTNTGIAQLCDLFKQFAVMALASFDLRRKHYNAFSGKLFQDEVSDLFIRVLYHCFPGFVRICNSHACIEQAQEVVDLGDRPNCRSWTARHRFLFNRDNRT